MSAKTFVICGLSFAAWVFLSIVYGIYRRVRRARLELREYKARVQLVKTKDAADEAEQAILWIG